MKFRRGAWLWEAGVTPAVMKRVTEYRVDADALSVSAVDNVARADVDKFEGTVLQLRVTSPMPDVLRVQVRHHHPIERGSGNQFELDYSLAAAGVRIDDRDDHLVFTSGKLSLRVAKSGWDLRFEDEAGRPVTAAGRESLGYMQVQGAGNFLMHRLSMGVGECIYGMGERFGPLVKNGQSVRIWNEDGGTCSDIAYKNLPFYLSSRGYGLFVNSPGQVDFEVATERVSQVQISVPGEVLDYYVFYGPDPKDVLDKYTRLAGRPAVPPAWSFGLWLSTSFTTQYDEQTVNEFVDGMRGRDIPLEVFHFDCFWMKERHWCDFEWDRRAFPHPEQMLERLKGKGLKVCVWINPYISSLSSLFNEGRENGYFLKRADGSVYQIDKWQPGMALVDFTNPAAVAWYQAKLRALLEMGVDSFKTDFGERIPDDAVYHDGSDPKRMHNFYAYLYNKAVFELLEEFHGKDNALVFARSASGGSQKFPVHWGGDCDATFESMAEDLRGGLSFCLSGPAFWSHDIGGFAGDATPALYKRWVAFGLLSTHSRLHGSESYRVPWLFDEESVVVLRHFTKLKNRLFPYLFAAAHDAREHGWPAMRAMVLEFPGDPACLHLDRQYMLGQSLLVAPIFREDNVAQYYLPAGKWTNLLTGQTADGPGWREEAVDFMHVPLFVRENTVLPTSGDEQHPQWRLGDPLTLNLFEIADGADLAVRVPASDGAGAATFRCRRAGDKITLTGNGRATDVRLLLRSVRSAGKITNGRLLREVAEGLVVEWSEGAKPITVTLTDR
ncbi:MAG TPA: alpha-xylosidase [Tepidisphaeraceae bacterium]|nr:alpha-xylosidase [Tepidisphaeraceae bacterium]